jgi:hypothetical protein
MFTPVRHTSRRLLKNSGEKKTLLFKRKRQRSMRGNDQQQGELFSYGSLEERASAGHPLRRIRKLTGAALAPLDRRFDELYEEVGRPSIAPEKLPRAMLLQVLYSVRSERALMDQIDLNLGYCWFVGLGPHEPACQLPERPTRTPAH